MKRSHVIAGTSALVLLIIGGIVYRMRKIDASAPAPVQITGGSAPAITMPAAAPVTAATGITQQVPQQKRHPGKDKKAGRGKNK